jgi:hypothetical protein
VFEQKKNRLIRTEFERATVHVSAMSRVLREETA